MLKNITVKNYNCFDVFDFSFTQNDHSLLLLGQNGSGKTTLANVLEIFQKTGRGEGRIGRLVSPSERWLGNNSPMTFDLTVMLDGSCYRYAFTVELPDGFNEMRVLSEELVCDDQAIYQRSGAKITFSPNHTGDFSYDWHVLFLPTFQDAYNGPRQACVDKFRRWLADILILSPDPKRIRAESSSFIPHPSRDCSDCVAWLGHLLAIRPKSYESIERYLRGIWDDFYTITHEQVGSQNRLLKLEFKDNKGAAFAPTLDVLSDGEKSIFVSAIVLAFREISPSALCYWDEPDNYLSLSEVGHLVQALRRTFFSEGQLIVSSHNPEVVNAFTESTSWVLSRGNHLSPTKNPRRVVDLRDDNGPLGKTTNLNHAIISGELWQ